MTAPTAPTDQLREAWDALADGFDRHLTPHTIAFGQEIVSRLELGPGRRVIDIGAGSGAVAIPAARTGAEVVAIDLAPTMIERLTARARAEGLATLSAEVGDGTALDVGDDRFDVAVSLNGVTVFPDLTAGLDEMVRVTRPGGEVVVGTFGPLPEVEFVAFLLAAMRAAAPEAMPASDAPPPPFRLADPTVFADTLRAAGLRDVTVEPVTWEIPFASVDDFLDVGMHGHPLPGQLRAGLTEEQAVAFRQVLDGMLRERSGGEAGAVLRASMRIGRGTV
ncbi:MAG: methyltransferase domain-containing protein [Actinobacteria bacterium]|nr:methyltransferase domain-containing protein [Actinomycetota bacterium]